MESLETKEKEEKKETAAKRGSFLGGLNQVE